jgi:hypothetical protein
LIWLESGGGCTMISRNDQFLSPFISKGNMSDKKKLSGAAFRKRKKEMEEKTVKLPKISEYFQVHLKNVRANEAEPSTELFEIDAEAYRAETSSAEKCNPTDVLSLNEPTDPPSDPPYSSSSSSAIQSDVVFAEKSNDEIKLLLTSLSNEKYPTDRGHFDRNIGNSQVKKFILECGPCRPTGPFPADETTDKRSFSAYFYFTKTKGGLKFSRSWLCYSPKLNRSYCEPCWLYADRVKLMHYAWIDGINDWQGLSKKINIHEASTLHQEACAIYDLWKKGNMIDKNLESQVRKESNFWRQVLHRLLNVSLFLAQQNIAFRGHSEHVGSGEAKGGNFLSLIGLLAKYDHVLQELIEKKEKDTKYLSPDTQNQFINIMSSNVQKVLLDEIRNAPFFSIILDTTPDITKIDQLSIVFRYVTFIFDSNQKVLDLQVNESFIEFYPVRDHTALGLKDIVTHFLEKHKIDFKKCRGQAYDGARIMSGAYNGLKAKLLELEKNAKYVHCAAHNLNLVVNDAVKGIPEVVTFFNTLDCLHKFFNASVKRWGSLHDTDIPSRTLKRLCPTRWSSRDEVLSNIRFKFCEVVKALAEVILKSKNPLERAEANGLKNKLANFNFIVLLVMFSKIFSCITPLSKYLQAKSIDMSDAQTHLSNAYDNIKQLRESFEDIKCSAIQLSHSWGVQTSFQDKRMHRIKSHFDELSQDQRIENNEKRFKAEIFNKVMDILSSRLHERFQSFRCVISKFNVLSPTVLDKVDDDELHRQAMILCNEYNDDLTESFPQEIVSFRTVMKTAIKNADSIRQLVKLIVCENSTLSASFPEVCTAYILFTTLPVTTATSERSFSKLKLIKNYLRSSMSQERLSGLSILSIEHETARKIDFDMMIDLFAADKCRRKNF